VATTAKKTAAKVKPEAPKKAPAAKPAVRAVAAETGKASAKPATAAAAKATGKKPAKRGTTEEAKKAPVNKVTDKMPMTSTQKAPAAKPSRKGSSEPIVKPGKPVTGKVLTEAEVLKMPERDYMNDAQLAFFKARLLFMKEEILANARVTGEHLKENEVFADPNDRATVEEENMLEQRVRDRERKLLRKIDSALGRIESGEYGFCLETGEPIGIPRLLARPTAELSIEAQEKHERMERLYAD
jgi:DnaK suppressor protein